LYKLFNASALMDMIPYRKNAIEKKAIFVAF